MDDGIFFAIATLLSPLFGLAGFVIGLREDRRVRQYDNAYQNVLTFQTLGSSSQVSQHPGSFEKIGVNLHYRGFEPQRGIRVCLVFEEGYFWLLSNDLSLEPGESLGPVYLDVLRSTLPGLRLHISWLTPHPSMHRKGLRYQALRLSPNQELQEWKWYRFESLRRKLHRPLGKWKTVKNPSTSTKSLPGWPDGRAAKTIDWKTSG
ncbi:hypothetical protein [Corynebacterium sp. Marseille-Q2823]|uniref:hypothetical protein n=1 Tax=Corynebacterium sp. Marseille-Q2823 TaxID=2736606 RepID=UPI00158A2CAB|nr:hypothetical protein [Corynebacterium sp. Marseille-Q2823]